MPYEFPDDATGDVLRRLEADGADLSKPHTIDFFVVVPDENAGVRLIEDAKPLLCETDLSPPEDDPEWTICFKKVMVPTYHDITSMEHTLDDFARKFGGRIDGWGAFPVS